MKGALPDVVAAVGDTPIVHLGRMASHVEADVHAKLEFLNPAGSVKDRPAIQIIRDAEDEGRLRPGGTIVEATSGNTGAALAMVGAIRGYKTVFVMPEKVSDEKVAGLRAWGARVVVCPSNVTPEDPRSYYKVAERIADESPGGILANQYHNPSNPRAHELSTGPELMEQTGGEVDVVVCTMGTGGTITGLGRYLKEQKPSIRIVGVDPVGSIFYDYFRTGRMTQAHTYRVEGFGEDFIPSTIDFSVIDEVIRVTDKECFQWTRRLVREEGIYAGGSAGGAVRAAIRYAERTGRAENVVVVLPDGASKYLSKIFDDNWMREGGYLDPDYDAGTVGELLERQPRHLVTASPGDSVERVIGLMKEHGISQVPIVDDEQHILGIISEKDLLNLLLARRASSSTPVDEYLDNAFAVVEPHNRASLLSDLFGQGNVVVVEEEGRVIGILTKIDFIDWVSNRFSS